MDFQGIDQFMKKTGLVAEPAFDYLHFLTENIPSSENRRILGLYYPDGDTEKSGFGYLPPSTIILPLDASESTLLHELGHRHGHFYYDNLSEEYAENYRRVQEKKFAPILAKSKEVVMFRQIQKIPGKPWDDVQRAMNHYGITDIEYLTHPEYYPLPERGSGLAKAGYPVAQSTLIINAPIKVTGVPAAAASYSYLIKATITCVHPDNNVSYSPAAGETKAELWRNHWAILPDEKLVEATVPAGGVITLLTVNVTELTLFFIRATHISTGNKTDVKFTCMPDGTWYFGW